MELVTQRGKRALRSDAPAASRLLQYDPSRRLGRQKVRDDAHNIALNFVSAMTFALQFEMPLFTSTVLRQIVNR